MLGLNLAALLLLASWLWPDSRALWDRFDAQAFHLLNHSLQSSPLWAGVWAVTSLRAFDLLAGGLMLFLLVRRDWQPAGAARFQALFTFIALLILLLLVRVLFSRLVDAFGWQHLSPSLTFADSVRLSQQYPWLAEHLDLKDASRRSFPSDHASVLMPCGAFMALFTRGGRLLAVVLLTLLLMLPRLIAGAHWISDDLVGGSILTLLALALGYCTPLAGWLAAGLQSLAEPILFRLPTRH